MDTREKVAEWLKNYWFSARGLDAPTSSVKASNGQFGKDATDLLALLQPEGEVVGYEWCDLEGNYRVQRHDPREQGKESVSVQALIYAPKEAEE